MKKDYHANFDYIVDQIQRDYSHREGIGKKLI
jgi:hypothetical protein